MIWHGLTFLSWAACEAVHRDDPSRFTRVAVWWLRISGGVVLLRGTLILLIGATS